MSPKLVVDCYLLVSFSTCCKVVYSLSYYTGAETQDMATETGIAPLQGDDAKSWFKRFEVCAAANAWDGAKKLLRVPTLLKSRPWAVFDCLTEFIKQYSSTV